MGTYVMVMRAVASSTGKIAKKDKQMICYMISGNGKPGIYVLSKKRVAICLVSGRIVVSNQFMAIRVLQ
jgi:hypothetical protein